MSYQVPILTPEEADLWEKECLREDEAKIWEAMNAAGRGAGRAMLQDFTERGSLPKAPKILVLAGKGHNAGDALLAADYILENYPQGQVDVLFTLGIDSLRPLVSKALNILQKRDRATFYDADEEIYRELLQHPFDFVIDGVFGMAFKPQLQESILTVLESVNKNTLINFRAAIDLPSGISDHPTTNAFNANFTYATGIAKTPLFHPENALFVGRIRLIDIGFFEKPYTGKCASNAYFLNPTILEPLRRLRPSTVSKKDFGHLFIVSGSKNMPGALLMSIQAALRSGVGLLTVFAPQSIATTLAVSVPEAMWVPCPETPKGALNSDTFSLVQEKISRATALLTGPGLGREPASLELVSKFLEHISIPILLDADALQLKTVQAASLRPSSFGPVLATPHQGEFMRLSGSQKETYNEASFLNFCKKSGMTVLLKGAITRICNGHTIACSPFGGPVLARGGSGDILSGIAAGLLAQKPTEAPELILSQAAVWHGLAADQLARQKGQTTSTTTDLLPFLSAVLRKECS